MLFVPGSCGHICVVLLLLVQWEDLRSFVRGMGGSSGRDGCGCPVGKGLKA